MGGAILRGYASFANEDGNEILVLQRCACPTRQQTPDIPWCHQQPVEEGSIFCRLFGMRLLVIHFVAGSDVEMGWLPSYIGISNRASVIASVVIFLVLLLLLVRNINIARSRRRRRRLRRDKALEIARHELEEEQRRRKRR